MWNVAGTAAIREIARTNACEIAGKMGDRLCDGLKELINRYSLPYVAYNQGSIVHLECTGAMSFDFSSLSFIKSALGLLKHKDMMYVRKDSMEKMGAAYMAGISAGIYDPETVYECIEYTKYQPVMRGEVREQRLAGWKNAVKQVLTHR